MKNNVKIGIRLVSLEDNSISIANANKITQEQALEKGGYNIAVHLILNKEKSTLGLRMDFSLNFKDEEFKKPLQDLNHLPEFKYSGTISFKTSGIDLSPGPNNKIDIPKSIMHKVAEIAYSTFRGVIFAKTIGTSLQGAVLPVVTDEQIALLVSQAPLGKK